MKELVLTLTDAQFRRFTTIGALLKAPPEHVVIGAAFGELDSWSDDWAGVEAYLGDVVEAYGEKRRAFRPNTSKDVPIEETAPQRRLRVARKEAACG